jgi:dTDP-4-amino-4,6-dideoxygalactose transaminase
LRTYGWTRPQFAEIQNGRGSRLDELQAAILAIRLEHLDAEIERRRAIARRYNEAFADLPLRLPSERSGCRHVYHLYVVRCHERDALARHLGNSGIMSGQHYPFAVHQQPGLAAGARIPRSLAITERIIQEILTLPLYPSMSVSQQERVVNSVRSFYRKS